MTRYVIYIFLCILLVSCGPDTYTPKPRGYYHIELPQRAYQSFNNAEYPYTFSYPVYGKVIKDTVYFDKKPENPYWINIDFPTLGGRIYLSYKQITKDQPLDKLLEDSYKLSYYHSKKADYIKDPTFANKVSHVYGVFYNIGGNAASSYQFYATDSISHFLRGSLYFDVSPNADSLKPVNDFLKKDMEQLITTLKWR